MCIYVSVIFYIFSELNYRRLSLSVHNHLKLNHPHFGKIYLMYNCLFLGIISNIYHGFCYFLVCDKVVFTNKKESWSLLGIFGSFSCWIWTMWTRTPSEIANCTQHHVSLAGSSLNINFMRLNSIWHINGPSICSLLLIIIMYACTLYSKKK